MNQKYDLDFLVAEYNRDMERIARNFTSSVPFLSQWVPDSDIHSTVLSFVESAALSGLTEVSLFFKAQENFDAELMKIKLSTYGVPVIEDSDKGDVFVSIRDLKREISVNQKIEHVPTAPFRKKMSSNTPLSNSFEVFYKAQDIQMMGNPTVSLTLDETLSDEELLNLRKLGNVTVEGNLLRVDAFADSIHYLELPLAIRSNIAQAFRERSEMSGVENGLNGDLVSIEGLISFVLDDNGYVIGYECSPEASQLNLGDRGTLELFGKISKGLPFREVADHGVHYWIAAAVDSDLPYPSRGIYNAAQVPDILKKIMDHLVSVVSERKLNGRMNFFETPIALDFLELPDQEKCNVITQAFKEFEEIASFADLDLEFVDLENNSKRQPIRVTLSITGVSKDEWPEILLDLEKFLRTKVSSKLQVFIEDMQDKSKKRRTLNTEIQVKNI